MPTFQIYNVIPTLPAALEPLREMTFNLWWTWEPSARRLFRHLDPDLWNRTNHNPVRMLQLSRQARLEELAPAPRSRNQWHIFPRSLDFTSRFRIIPAAWAFSPATTANRPAISI